MDFLTIQCKYENKNVKETNKREFVENLYKIIAVNTNEYLLI